MKKIVITGVESSGKSTLAHGLSENLNVPLVTEYARTYLSDLKRSYKFEDLTIMAQGQLELEQEHSKSNIDCLICDTGLLVYKIWSEYKYGRLDSFIAQAWSTYRCDLYILPLYDIPYESDPMRESPSERHILFQLYKDTLEQNNLPYVIVSGDRKKRLVQAQIAIKTLIPPNT